jgi:cell division protein ZapB
MTYTAIVVFSCAPRTLFIGYHTLTPGPAASHTLYQDGIDRTADPHYIVRMANNNSPTQIDLELTRLEEQVASLLETVEHLSQENRSLRTQQDSMANERANLLEKHDQVRNRVDAIVTRLKSLETGI